MSTNKIKKEVRKISRKRSWLDSIFAFILAVLFVLIFLFLFWFFNTFAEFTNLDAGIVSGIITFLITCVSGLSINLLKLKYKYVIMNRRVRKFYEKFIKYYSKVIELESNKHVVIYDDINNWIHDNFSNILSYGSPRVANKSVKLFNEINKCKVDKNGNYIYDDMLDVHIWSCYLEVIDAMRIDLGVSSMGTESLLKLLFSID